jgi:hypothetical protein
VEFYGKGESDVANFREGNKISLQVLIYIIDI